MTASPRLSPAEIVTAFLAALEARDLQTAKSFFGPGFSMTFPAGRHYTSLEDFVAGAKGRYGWVKKTHERIDIAPSDDGHVVYIFGTLRGEWLDGTAFTGIRYIDRFVVRDGKLVDQMVWNDLGEVRLMQG